MKISLWLGLLLAVVASAGGYWLTDKTISWEASAVYTVVPKTSGEQLAYTDIQAANLFIDVIRSWLLNPSAKQELAQAYPEVKFTELPRLSMQTFALQVIGKDNISAQHGLLKADAILQRELARYNGSGEMTQFSAYQSDIVTRTTARNPWWNSVLSGLITLVVGAFLGLLINYYRRAYAHRS